MKLILDTCVLIWWTLDRQQLSSKAREVCEKMERKDGAMISSISLWEIGIKIKNKKIDIGMSIDTYAAMLRELGYLKIMPVDERIWLKNLSLEWSHRDPADRTIVATAELNRCHLVSSDEHMRRFYKLCLW